MPICDNFLTEAESTLVSAGGIRAYVLACIVGGLCFSEDDDLKSTLCDDLLIDKEYHWSNLCSSMILMELLCG
jgi:hypothetical protein